MGRRCEETRELAAELALGVADGEERGRALKHLAGCPECRAEVERLSEVADELSLLAPHREPPVGFESRVLSGLGDEPPRARPWRVRPVLRVLLPAAAAAAAAVAITLTIVSDDLRLADHYRGTLTEANGREFDAYAIRDPADGTVGRVFAYEGSPSWLLMTVDSAHRSGVKGAELVMDDGRRVPIRWFYMTQEWGTCGGLVDVDLSHVSVVRLLSKSGSQPLVARFQA